MFPNRHTVLFAIFCYAHKKDLARDLQELERETALRRNCAGAVVKVHLDQEGRPGLAPQG